MAGEPGDRRARGEKERRPKRKRETETHSLRREERRQTDSRRQTDRMKEEKGSRMPTTVEVKERSQARLRERDRQGAQRVRRQTGKRGDKTGTRGKKLKGKDGGRGGEEATLQSPMAQPVSYQRPHSSRLAVQATGLPQPGAPASLGRSPPPLWGGEEQPGGTWGAGVGAKPGREGPSLVLSFHLPQALLSPTRDCWLLPILQEAN